MLKPFLPRALLSRLLAFRKSRATEEFSQRARLKIRGGIDLALVTAEALITVRVP